jgi:hypothetical protein
MDIVEIRNAFDIDDHWGTFDPVFHINQKIGPSSENFGSRLVSQNGDGLIDVIRLKIVKFW